MRTEWAGERGKLKPPSACDASAPEQEGTRIHRIVHICVVAVALCSVAACTQRTDGHASRGANNLVIPTSTHRRTGYRS
ncbi:hypothetical protein [Mycobacterium sp. AZCC_0083]|uniref:hypothetical protein n=1 Tax=Mycobacterium sp. AZCC_0083 TaxID=2735882 RepID=UPI0016103682|nr:hypothetical protein [Mycobacterium sp. AZCC_0083]MBB5161415.1 hypothetical protein [Mycobacterium sp. AZCC_0083]